MRYSETQKKIAQLLVDGPQTPEELNKKLSVPYSDLMQELKAMMGLKVVERQEGFPTRYSLKQDIAQEVKRRQDLAENDKNKLHLRAIIETQAVEPEILKRQTEKLGDAIKKEEGFIVYSLTQAPTLKQEEMYSTFLDVTLSLKDFRALVRFMYFYGPTTLEVLKPAKLELDSHDLQEGLMDMSQMIARYSEYLTKLLNRSEIENLNRRLLK